MSAMLLEKNGKKSSTKNTKYINVRYYFIDKTRAQAFHHAVSQLLFTGIRCRNDAQTEIAFLNTRVRKPDKDDYKKLRRLIGYLKRTIKLPLILQAD